MISCAFMTWIQKIFSNRKFLSQHFSIQCVHWSVCEGMNLHSFHTLNIFKLWIKQMKTIKIKTLTATTFTTKTDKKKGTKFTDCSWSAKVPEPSSRCSPLPIMPFFFFLSSCPIPRLRSFLNMLFYSARTSHRSTASQDGQYTYCFKNTIRTRDRHKGDDIITRRGATKMVVRDG